MSPVTAGGLPTLAPRDRLARVGLGDTPWAFPPWAYASEGRFHGRWDDPEGLYRVLYAASEPLGCWLEVLAVFRPDPEMLADLDEIEADPADTAHPTAPAGVVPRSFFARRTLGWASPGGRYVDVGAAEAIAVLRRRMAARLMHYGLADLDGAALRLTAPRAFTQEIGRLVYGDHVDGEPVAGIAYQSRHGNDIALWAVFERPVIDLGHITVERVDPDHDTAVQQALRLHGLRLA